MTTKACSFCEAQESEDNPLIAGESAYICSNCVVSAYKILFGEEEQERTRWLSRDGRFVDVFFRQLQVLWCRLKSISPLWLVQKHQIFVSKGTLFLGKYQRF